jgi:hypothetical protein
LKYCASVNGVKKLTMGEEGREAPSNSEMMVSLSLSGTSAREVAKRSKLVIVVVIDGGRYSVGSSYIHSGRKGGC